MDNFVSEQGSVTQQGLNGSLVMSLPVLASIVKWLANFVKLTEEELEDAGIYLGRMGDE